MKIKILLFAFTLISAALQAQQTESGIVKLRGTRLTYPLVRKWIAEFNKEYPNIHVSIAQHAPSDSIDFTLAAHSIIAEDLSGNKDYITVSRYTQLPVANSKRDGLAALQAKGFTEKDFNNLYFAASPPTLLTASTSPVTLYTRERPTCATITFARHFGNDPKSIQGIGVKGDDQDLANAVKEDVNGISFNNLGFIYDVTSRKVTEGLAIIPVDLNENGKIDGEEKIYNTLDEVIAFVEKTNHPKLITEGVNVLYSKTASNKAAGIFMNWVLTKGQQYNHDLGFVNLLEGDAVKQLATLNTTYRVSSASCAGAEDALQKRKQKASTNQ